MASWDDDNYEPTDVKKVPAISDKWDGEDEDDEVKESWEDEDEEKSKEETEPTQEIVKPKKLTLAEKISEKERLKQEQMLGRLQSEEDDVSNEEKLKRQQESDLKLFVETTCRGTGDGAIPETKEEFEEYGSSLAKQIQCLSKSAEYPTFAENLVRDICVTLSSNDIKKIKNAMDNLYIEKQKIEKGDKAKKGKAKGKVRLKMEDANQYSAYAIDTYDYDDFM